MSQDRSKYLLKKYGITAVEYAQMAIQQGGACKCCGRVPTGDYPLHVDHSHKVAASKILMSKDAVTGKWIAQVMLADSPVLTSPVKADLIVAMKKWLLLKSVRGLVCWHCNTVLRWARDKADVLRSAAKYLDDFAATL